MAATSVLIMGESGTGKSTSIRTLDSSKTFLISIIDKKLPFRGSHYVKGENQAVTDDWSIILKIIENVNRTMPHITSIVIDDFQYLMANDFMRRSMVKGFDKFTEIQKNAFEVLSKMFTCRDDLTVFFLAHTMEKNGKYGIKTIGKMLDEKITIEGMFTIVLHSIVTEEGYLFLTQSDGTHIAKSPMGMFDDVLINNDLQRIKEDIVKYYSEDAPIMSESLSCWVEVPINHIETSSDMESLKDLFKAAINDLNSLSIEDSEALYFKNVITNKFIDAKDKRKKYLEELNKEEDGA